MEIEMIVWSDNDNIREVADIIHDEGYRTAEIRKESLGAYEDKCNWQWCKINAVDSVCVDINDAMGQIVPTEQVEEMPMFRYVAVFIIEEDDETEDTMEDTTEEQEQVEETMEKTTNVVINIGMTTKDGVKIDIDSAMDTIGKETDCTITRCVGFYHGKREYSLKVEIYDTRSDIAVSMASYFCHIFQQECVAVTIGNTTVFVTDDYTEDEFISWCDTLDK